MVRPTGVGRWGVGLCTPVLARPERGPYDTFGGDNSPMKPKFPSGVAAEAVTIYVDVDSYTCSYSMLDCWLLLPPNNLTRHPVFPPPVFLHSYKTP